MSLSNYKLRNLSFEAWHCFLILFFFAFTANAQPSAKSASKPKYNVLFIIADDLRPELGAYGVKAIKTPNIDKIAATGTRFDRAYAQYPVCNPSRTSFLTGRYPLQTGVMNNNDYFRRKFPDMVTLPQYFKNNGYASLRSGKIFHGGIDDQVSWTEGGEPTDPAITERGNRLTQAVLNSNAPQDPQTVQARKNTSASDTIIVLPGEGESHGDYKTATKAIEYLDKYKDKPFFLAVGFVKPHSPPSAPKRFFDLYDVTKMELPADFGTTPKASPGFPAISISATNSDLFIGRESPPLLSKEMKRAYYASTSYMDAQVGRVMEALKRNNLEKNTIVVFFGDHGYHLGEKGKWSKAYSMYELGLRVPLLIAVPNGKAQQSSQIVELIDLYPTLADLCGLSKPAGTEGQSLKSLLQKPESKWNFPAYSVTGVQKIVAKSVRTKRWHYVEWDEGRSGSMLTDVPNDPHEWKNLVNDPKYSVQVKEMKMLLQKMPASQSN
ncbi:MAG: sulfatase [Pyrinomonadaceae bacterium]|nr:sulfatase [Sphingobacteriaceae bacterium]